MRIYHTSIFPAWQLAFALSCVEKLFQYAIQIDHAFSNPMR